MSTPPDLGTPSRRKGKPPLPPPILPPFSPPPPPPPLPVEPPEPDDGRHDEITASEALEYRRLIEEKARRKVEALNLYTPLPIQHQFHQCRARARLLRGSNRAGKTLSAAVEFARAVTGRDPHAKYPLRDGRAYVIGKDEKHLGEVIYRKLFRSGAFKVIRDLVTGEWRAFRPWELADKMRAAEAKPAPPLIPPRYVKSITWKSKGDNIPEKVTLVNGWEIDFWSSLSKPPRGSDLDLVWFDEEIVDSDWYPEMSARLLDRAGKMFWGATPQTGSDRLYELHCRCEQEWEAWRAVEFTPDEEPSAREFLILLSDNPHIDERQKDELAKDLTEEEAAVRLGGGFAVEASKVWPEYAVKTHDVPYFDIPPHWTRLTITDPGRQVCAVLFAAVPKPGDVIPVGVDRDGEPVVTTAREDRPYIFLYDELYITACDADKYGERMAYKCSGQHFNAFVIDRHGSRISDTGSGRNVEEQYADALRRHRVACERTGHGFTWGSDDVDAGVLAVRELLRLRDDGRPVLMTVDVRSKLPNFKYEIDRYRYKRTNNITTEKPEDRGRVHQMANLRYLAMYRPTWVEPPAGVRLTNSAYAVFQRKQAARAKRDGGGGVSLGPPTRG